MGTVRADIVTIFILSPVNVLDQIQKRFGYGLLWPLWPACNWNQAGSHISDSVPF